MYDYDATTDDATHTTDDEDTTKGTLRSTTARPEGGVPLWVAVHALTVDLREGDVGRRALPAGDDEGDEDTDEGPRSLTAPVSDDEVDALVDTFTQGEPAKGELRNAEGDTDALEGYERSLRGGGTPVEDRSRKFDELAEDARDE